MISVKAYGAEGKGKTDDFTPLQKAIEKEEELFFPKGIYLVSDTIKIPSDRKLVFEKGAIIKLDAKTKRKRGDFLLSNKDVIEGNENIEIVGATFDGNNKNKNHRRPNDIFKEDGYSGILINFCNVKNLVLSDITLQNPVSYYTRFCKIDGFLIENIILKSKKFLLNQDGIHFAGKVKNGKVKNVRVETYGQTNDDLLALNADDYLCRIEEFDTECGAIENVVFEDIFAESCHDAIRLLSFVSEIKNITFRNLKIGFRKCAVECNAARGCRAELFKEEDHPEGVGNLKDITFIDCEFWHAEKYPLFWKGSLGTMPHPLIHWGSKTDGVKFVNCRMIPDPNVKQNSIKKRILSKLKKKAFPIFFMKNVPGQTVKNGEEIYKTVKKEDTVILSEIKDLTIDFTKEQSK